MYESRVEHPFGPDFIRKCYFKVRIPILFFKKKKWNKVLVGVITGFHILCSQPSLIIKSEFNYNNIKLLYNIMISLCLNCFRGSIRII